MTSTNNETSDLLIKLTRDELMGQHVDELLQRQMNLRGEKVQIERRRTWYYQNWFIFMVVGCLAAILAWAIVEPYFDDVYYIQGKIEEVQFSESYNPEEMRFSKSTAFEIIGRIRIREDWVAITNQTGTIQKGVQKEFLSAKSLTLNREIGAYVDYLKGDQNKVPVVLYVTFTPDPNASEKAYMSISQLDSRHTKAAFFLFPLVAAFIGLALGAVDGIICRVFRRALIGGVVGFFIGLIGSFFSSILGGIIYNLLSSRETFTTMGFLLQIIARTLAWGIVGMASGLGYGISLRSKRLILYGFLGGIIGGLLGGMFFDPIDILLLGPGKMSGHLSRLIGLALIGAAVGMAIGIVELLSREAWLRMTQGSLAGKEFIVFKDIMRIGSSPNNEIYLFNDPQVKNLHAKLFTVGDEYEIESQDMLKPVLVNDRPVKSARLRNGDQIALGKTIFIFEKREK